MKHLRQSPKWSKRIPASLHVKDSPWPMRHLKAKPTEVIAADELRVLLSACTKEVITTMQRIEAGWRLRDEARKAVPDHPKSYKDYADLGNSRARFYVRILSRPRTRAYGRRRARSTAGWARCTHTSFQPHAYLCHL